MFIRLTNTQFVKRRTFDVVVQEGASAQPEATATITTITATAPCLCVQKCDINECGAIVYGAELESPFCRVANIWLCPCQTTIVPFLNEMKERNNNNNKLNCNTH